jgi:hypothetical protein
MLVKGPSKHMGVSRIGASLIPGEFVKFNGCKCSGHIIDIVCRNSVQPYHKKNADQYKNLVENCLFECC